MILCHGNAPLTFPLPSRIQESSVVTAVDEDGNIRFQVIVVIVQIYFQLSLDSQAGVRTVGFTLRMEDLGHLHMIK